jgi:hypothetical protein
MLSSVRAITRRALIVASAGVLALSTLPAAAADSLDELVALNARAWSGEPELLAEVYGSEGVHSATFYDGSNVYTGADEIAAVAGSSFGPPQRIGPQIEVPATEGEYRWADFYGMGGGTACLWRVADDMIVRHDCLLSEKRMDSRPVAELSDGSRSAEIDEVLERLDPSWGPESSLEALAAVYAPDAVHSARFLNTTRSYEGPAEIMAVASGGGTISQIGPRMEFATPEGELAWAQVSDVAGGTVCLFRAVDGMITRHDCLLPIST